MRKVRHLLSLTSPITHHYFVAVGDLSRVILTNRLSIEQYLKRWLPPSNPSDAINIPQLGEFIRAMLQIRPTDRATADELLNHPWLASELEPSS